MRRFVESAALVGCSYFLGKCAWNAITVLCEKFGPTANVVAARKRSKFVEVKFYVEDARSSALIEWGDFYCGFWSDGKLHVYDVHNSAHGFTDLKGDNSATEIVNVFDFRHRTVYHQRDVSEVLLRRHFNLESQSSYYKPQRSVKSFVVLFEIGATTSILTCVEYALEKNIISM